MVARLDSDSLKTAAVAAGFHKAGVARAEPLDPGALDRALEAGADAEMGWLRRTRAERLDPARLLPGVRSVLALALAHDAGRDLPEPKAARIARYARGRDYHAVMKKRLKVLLARISELDPDARTYASSDIAPVMEKVWAERAGLGWIGKNGCLITTDLGSWVLLATVLIDRDLVPDPPHPRRCGTCEACVTACPTAAIVESGLVDVRRCISFQTIEKRGVIPETVAERLGPWVFGCDECQTACPWNRPARLADTKCDPELLLRPGQSGLDLDGMLMLSLPDYQRRFYGTSLARARYEGLLRNSILAAAHDGDPSRLPGVRRHLESPFEGVRAAALWAVERLTGTADSER